MELHSPKVIIPASISSFHDIYAVIEARERTVQSLRGFLASMGYIRGNGSANRTSGLRADGLRRSRSKLARLLAKIRVYSTLAVELILRRASITLSTPSCLLSDLL